MPGRRFGADAERPLVYPEAVIEALGKLAEGGHFSRHVRLSLFELWALAEAWSDTTITRRELRATLGAAGLMAGDRGAGYETYELVRAIRDGGALQQLRSRYEAKSAELVERQRKRLQEEAERPDGAPSLLLKRRLGSQAQPDGDGPGTRLPKPANEFED